MVGVALEILAELESQAMVTLELGAGTGFLMQRVHVDGIVDRNAGRRPPDPRFADAAQVRNLLDGLEESEGDCPLPVAEDLALLRESGIPVPVVFWQEYHETVLGGRRGF